jgi:hypothetical protein
VTCDAMVAFQGPAPFKDMGVTLVNIAFSTYGGTAVTAEPRFPSLDVNSVYVGMPIKAKVTSACAEGSVLTKTEVLPPLP